MSTRYVGTTGSDTTGDGTIGSPYASITFTLTLCSNGDTIKILDGTYTISSIINVNKNVTITSNSTNKANVTLTGSQCIFNVTSNASITYMTLSVSHATDPVVSISPMSDGTTVPTFNTVLINNCNINYTNYALVLNGTFTVSSNTFSRLSSAATAYAIQVYTCRGGSISTNTFSDTNNVKYFIWLTDNKVLSGTYYDYCSSKGGALNIQTNSVLYNGTYSSKFIYMDYFNKYIDSSSEGYNVNTKLALNINNNTIQSNNINIIFAEYYLSTSTDLTAIDKSVVNNNNINNTTYGAVHISKNENNSTITIPSSDLNRNVFKIYSNILDTIVTMPSDYMARYDASDNTTVRNASGNACTVGEAVATLLDKSSNHYDLVQATNNRRPFLIYNTTYKKNMIDPNMVNRSRFMRNASLTLSQYFTIITVTTSLSAESRVWNFAGSVGNGTLIANTYGEVWLPGSRNTWVKGTPHFENGITIVRYNTNNTVKCINVSTTNVTTTPINNVAFTPNLLMSGFELGNYYTDYSYTGGIGEIIIYNRALSDAEVTDTINALRAKWTV